ncbi:uncharacterized protein BXZ73DRAFT_107761 [Epithele typhae]|uniref:uncharacterized protein n=1 Tax=Epithele typhae TaxID=378194 RepID=UPI002008B61F|nr:uncharacterized protein BXZ73DRAFT_107761 [Epithele typhae]KAH9911929.1 hypothetical protein BXZ73DRAFT_107761 [Epithele typhae]
MSVHVGGFWFPSETIHHLLTTAYSVPNVTPHDALDTAIIYFVDYKFLHCPNLIEHHINDNSGTLAKGHLLVCRLAFVDDGLKAPDLSLDQSTRACADHWFPPSVRELEIFKDVRYIQCEYTGYRTVPVIRSKEKEYDMTPQQKRRPNMPKWLRRRHEFGRTFIYLPPGVPASYIYADDGNNSDNTSESDSSESFLCPHTRRGTARKGAASDSGYSASADAPFEVAARGPAPTPAIILVNRNLRNPLTHALDAELRVPNHGSIAHRELGFGVPRLHLSRPSTRLSLPPWFFYRYRPLPLAALLTALHAHLQVVAVYTGKCTSSCALRGSGTQGSAVIAVCADREYVSPAQMHAPQTRQVYVGSDRLISSVLSSLGQE